MQVNVNLTCHLDNLGFSNSISSKKQSFKKYLHQRGLIVFFVIFIWQKYSFLIIDKVGNFKEIRLKCNLQTLT